MAEGWIKLHRQICDNPLWLLEKFTPAQAWVDLVLNANHADGYFTVRGNRVDVKRGQIGWSEVTMSTRWKWSRTRVRNFLKTLEKEQQIEQQKTSITSIITILNYEKYQGEEQQEEQQSGQQKNSRKTAEEQQKNTNKNVKKNKNDKNEKKKDIIGEFSPEFSKTLNDFKEMRQRIRKPMTDRAVELLLKNLNNLTTDESEMIEILEQSITNSWQGVFPLRQPKQQQKTKTDKAIELVKYFEEQEGYR